MPDQRKEMQKLFAKRSRYANFGHAIIEATVKGFRGIDDVNVKVESPITAFTGLNGSGKSTIAQLMMSAYKRPITENPAYKRHHISNYFPVSKADPMPFRVDASIEYKYLTNAEDRYQEVTVKRGLGKQWDGYKRQPERHCRYIGFTIYIPKVEQRDISIYRGNDIDILDESQLPEEARIAIAKILNSPYSELTSATASHNQRSTPIGFATKYGSKYSENNMGFGEGRVFYTVSSLESAPEQSLFVIEEPETSLHEHAQYEFAKYLIDVVVRRKHQVFLTTHSKSIISALPPESRKLLYREGNAVKISDRTSTSEAIGLLSLGKSQDKIVLVEDRKAKILLTELIRVQKPTLLSGIKISYVGNDDVVASLTRQLKADDYKVVGVRDGDKGEDVRAGLLKLPGSLPPEREVFGCENVKQWMQTHHSFNFDDWVQVNVDQDHHDWPKLVSQEVRRTEDGLWEQVCAEYAKGRDQIEVNRLIENIER